MSFKDWPFWAKALCALFIVGGVTAITMYATINVMHSTKEEACLIQIIDNQWSYTGHMKSGESREEAHAQAEAIARVHISQAEKSNASVCPPGWIAEGRKTLYEQVTGSDPKSERGRIIAEVARDALRGNYKTPWPESYSCVSEYKATRLRISPRLTNWSLRPVGKIGTMTLYCSS